MRIVASVDSLSSIESGLSGQHPERGRLSVPTMRPDSVPTNDTRSSTPFDLVSLCDLDCATLSVNLIAGDPSLYYVLETATSGHSSDVQLEPVSSKFGSSDVFALTPTRESSALFIARDSEDRHLTIRMVQLPRGSWPSSVSGPIPSSVKSFVSLKISRSTIDHIQRYKDRSVSLQLARHQQNEPSISTLIEYLARVGRVLPADVSLDLAIWKSLCVEGFYADSDLASMSPVNDSLPRRAWQSPLIGSAKSRQPTYSPSDGKVERVTIWELVPIDRTTSSRVTKCLVIKTLEDGGDYVYYGITTSGTVSTSSTEKGVLDTRLKWDPPATWQPSTSLTWDFDRSGGPKTSEVMDRWERFWKGTKVLRLSAGLGGAWGRQKKAEYDEMMMRCCFYMVAVPILSRHLYGAWMK